VNELAEHDYLTVKMAAKYAGLSYSHWQRSVRPIFPPGNFYGRLIYRRADVDFFRKRMQSGEIWRSQQDRACSARQSRERRLAKLNRIPSWADLQKIDEIYVECARRTEETGIAHHVDHEIPLRGKLVSGLHVHWNLRILPAGENLRKSNRYTP
jgi:hypothetical protein